MSQGAPQLFPTQQPSRAAEAKLHVLAKVGLYLVALGIPLFGALAAIGAARIANRSLYFSRDGRLAELRRHGWIAGVIGTVVWLGIPIGLGGLKKWREGQLPPVALAYTQACEARIAENQRMSVEGYLTMPTGVRNPCYTTGCMVALAEHAPRPKVFEGAIIKVSMPLGDAPGAFRVFTDGTWSARASDGAPLDARTRVRVTGTRLPLGMGQCSVTAGEIQVIR